MAQYCSDCTHFDLSKNKGGPGCHRCMKSGKFMFGHQERCEKFEDAYARSSFEKEKIYDQGKALANKFVPSEGDGYALFALVILAIILAIFGLL